MIVEHRITDVIGMRVRLCKWKDIESLYLIIVTPDCEVETLLWGYDGKIPADVLKYFHLHEIEIRDYRDEE